MDTTSASTRPDGGTPWCDPPPGGVRGQNVWAGRLAPLRDRPGEWARWPASSNGMGFYIKSQYPGFDATHRSIDGEQFLYVRWVGVDANGVTVEAQR